MVIRHSFDLDPVGFLQFTARMGNSVLQCAIRGQEQQALAVGIETPGRIDIGHFDEVSETRVLGMPGKLAHGAKWLIEGDQVRRHGD